jgi:hypothetical protein
VISDKRLLGSIGIVSGLIATISALPIFSLCHAAGICDALFRIALPGVVLSMVVFNYAHSPWHILLFNWIFYAVVLTVLLKAVKVIRGN